jgi:hypothetical protein
MSIVTPPRARLSLSHEEPEAGNLHIREVDIEDSTLNNDGEAVLDELRAAEKMYPAIVDDPDYGRPQYWWNPDIVHAPESARFTEIFRDAPIWLLQFTKMRIDAPVLEFDLPDISAKLLWGVEGVKDAKRWPRLPLGTMAAGDPVCTAPEEFGSDLSPEERRFYQRMKGRPEDEWARGGNSSSGFPLKIVTNEFTRPMLTMPTLDLSGLWLSGH